MNPLENSPFNGPLTPHQFRSQNNTQTPSQPLAPATTTGSRTKFIPIVLGALALLVLPVTVWQINQQQDIRQQASVVSTEGTALAIVYGEKITDRNLDEEYASQLNSTIYRVAPSNLKAELLRTVVNKKLIAAEAETRGITVDSSEIEEKINQLVNEGIAPQNTQILNDMVLEEKVAAAVAPFIRGTVIFTPLNENGENLLSQILDETGTGNLQQAAQPYFQRNEVVVLNNKFLNENNGFFSEEIFNTLFELPIGSISEVFEYEDNIYLVQINEKGEGEYESFEKFLDEKYDESVKLLPSN